jgi:transmembrane sensor
MRQQVNHPITDQLLVRFLTGEADTAERAAVTHWLHASEANSRYYATLVQAASYAQPQVDTSHIDEEAEWRAFKAIVQEAGPSRKGRVVSFSRQWLRIAAIFMLLAGAAVVYLLSHAGSGRSIALVSGKQVLTGTLPDGSGITLNKRSAVYYGRSYNNKDRDLQLTGEAFFAVAPNHLLPFIIHVQDIRVEVLGTSFNIKATEDSTEIIVESGEVQVKKGRQLIHLHAKEKATLYKGNPTLLKQPNPDALYNYYRTKKFVCNGTPLGQLVAALNNAYDQHISIPDIRDGQLPITATFTDRSATDVLTIICATLQLTATRQGDTIILKKRSNL